MMNKDNRDEHGDDRSRQDTAEEASDVEGDNEGNLHDITMLIIKRKTTLATVKARSDPINLS